MSTAEFIHRRVHQAGAELLFDCMTDPEHLTHFWGPAGTSTPVDGIVVDLRVGGTFETRMISDDTGDVHVMRAVYEEVDRPRRLTWREVVSGMTTTLSFVDRGDGTTEVVTHQRRLPEAYQSPQARAGWASALERFAEYVSTTT